MHLTSVMLSCLLFVQGPINSPPSIEDSSSPTKAPQAETPFSMEELTEEPTGPATGTPSGDSTALVPPAESRITASTMVAEILALPDAGNLIGRPLNLLEALSIAVDRSDRLAVTEAYWRLTSAVAEYRFCFDEYLRLGPIKAAAVDAVMLQTARTSAARALQAAKVTAVEAQYHLAEAVKLPPDAALPLPADPPYVGSYTTFFDEVFSARNPPARTRLIHRTLPIRLEAIEIRTLAVHAAEDAFRATIDAYQAGRVDLAAVFSTLKEWGRQRRALITSVCDYNRDIADYALTLVGPETTGRDLVSMLIELKRDVTGPLSSTKDSSEATPASGVQQAEYLESVPAKPKDLGQPSGVNRPTLAPPREPAKRPAAVNSSSQDDADPALTPPLEFTRPLGTGEPGDSPPANAEPWEAAPSTDDPGTVDSAAEPVILKRPLVPVPPEESKPTEQTANKPLSDPQATPETPALYPALVDAQPVVRTKHLTEALHWNRALPKPAGEPVGLEECLRGQSGADRQRVIDAYWHARWRAAEYQVLLARAEMIEQLEPGLARGHSGPIGLERPPRLRPARLAADAQVREAHVRLIESQFELTRLVGRPLDSTWLLPSTPPHSGPYLLKLEAQPRSLIESWPVRRLAATIPALADSLNDRAAAVVEADRERAAVTAAYQAGTRPVDPVLSAIDRQTDETLAFLETLTAYNHSIAEYVLTVLPATVPGDRLVGALVVVR